MVATPLYLLNYFLVLSRFWLRHTLSKQQYLPPPDKDQQASPHLVTPILVIIAKEETSGKHKHMKKGKLMKLN